MAPIVMAVAALGCAGTPSADRATRPTAGAPHTARNPALEVVRRVQDVYRNTQRFAARFRQKVVNKTFGLASVSNGNLYFKRPDKMRWDFVSRRDNRRVTRSSIWNGKVIWAVDVSGRWYYRQDLSKSALPVAVIFLTNTGDLSKELDAKLLTGSTHGAATDKILELTPKNVSASFRTLVLVVDPVSFRVKKSIVTSATGDTMEFSFYERDIARRVADAWFVFTPAAATASGFRQIKATGTHP